MKLFLPLLVLITTTWAQAQPLLNFTSLVLPEKNGIKASGKIYRRSLVFSEGKIVEDRVRSNEEVDQYLTDLPETFFKNSSYCSLQSYYFLDSALPSSQVDFNKLQLPDSISLQQQSFMIERFSQYQKPVVNLEDIIAREEIKPLMRVGFDGRVEVTGSPGKGFTVETTIQGVHTKLELTNFSCSFPFFKNEPAVNEELIQESIRNALGI